MDFSLPQANDFFTASFYALSPLIPWLLTVIPMGWGGGGVILMIVVLPMLTQFILVVIQSFGALKSSSPLLGHLLKWNFEQ